MAHFCRICGRHRPNESFSGRGHKEHVCKACQSLPIDVRTKILGIDEIEAMFHRQSHISAKNCRRLQALALSANAEVAMMATLVREAALVAPNRRKRLSVLRKNNPDLLERLVTCGLVEEWIPYEEELDLDFLSLLEREPFDHGFPSYP